MTQFLTWKYNALTDCCWWAPLLATILFGSSHGQKTIHQLGVFRRHFSRDSSSGIGESCCLGRPSMRHRLTLSEHLIEPLKSKKTMPKSLLLRILLSKTSLRH